MTFDVTESDLSSTVDPPDVTGNIYCSHSLTREPDIWTVSLLYCRYFIYSSQVIIYSRVLNGPENYHTTRPGPWVF